MPPKKTPPPNVARLTPEEQISYLFHQYEGFADWRIQVDARLQETEAATKRLDEKVDALGGKIGRLGNKVDTRMTEILLVQQQVLIAVQGQRIPGLEVPGLSDKYTALESRMTTYETKTDARISPLEAWKNRVLWTAGGLSLAGSLAMWHWGDKIKFMLDALTK